MASFSMRSPRWDKETVSGSADSVESNLPTTGEMGSSSSRSLRARLLFNSAGDAAANIALRLHRMPPEEALAAGRHRQETVNNGGCQSPNARSGRRRYGS